MAARGRSVHIGIDHVRPECFGDAWYGPLAGCEADMTAMRAVCDSVGFDNEEFRTAAATRAAVKTAILVAAAALDAGDTFVLTYAGHGGSLLDPGGDEPDGRDETWCLYDGHLYDDELYTLWSAFRPGVKILVVSDSCHSGTILWKASLDLLPKGLAASAATAPLIPRAMPAEVGARMYGTMKAEHEAARQNRFTGTLGASIILLAACRDNELSYEQDGRGLFTMALTNAMAKVPGRKGYHPLILDARETLSGQPPGKRQTPDLKTLGQRNDSFLYGSVFAL